MSAVCGFFFRWDGGGGGRVSFVLPTGTAETVIAARKAMV